MDPSQNDVQFVQLASPNTWQDLPFLFLQQKRLSDVPSALALPC